MTIRRVITWLVGLSVLAGVIVAVAATTTPRAAANRGAGARRLTAGITATVSAYTPGTRSVSEQIRVSGVVGDATPLTITPQTTGPIASLSIAPGDHVTAGQVVATLGDTQGLAAKQAQAKAALAQAQATLDQADAPAAQPAQVAQAQSQVDAAQTALASAQAKLQADQDAASRPSTPATSAPALPGRRAAASQSPASKTSSPASIASASEQAQIETDRQAVDSAQRQLSSAQSYLASVQHPAALPSNQIDAAQSAVNADQAAVDAATTALDQLKVSAAVSGTVASVYAQLGGSVSPATPIAELAGSSEQVSATVPPAVAAQLSGHVGATASISLAVPNPPAAGHGTLAFVAPSANPQTQQTDITLDSTGSAAGLTPGSPVTATITVPLGRQTTIPAQAVSYVDGKAGVYVLADVLDPSALGVTLPATIPAGTLVATTRFTPVTVLAIVGADAAVRAALPKSATVVSTGQTSVNDGQRVAVLPS